MAVLQSGLANGYSPYGYIEKNHMKKTNARHSLEYALMFRRLGLPVAAITLSSLAGAVMPALAQTTDAGGEVTTLKKVQVTANELGEITDGTGS
jgi:hypothetical protein